MANQISVTVYGSNQNDWNKTSGVVMSFPTQGIYFETISPAVSYSGVACNTAVKLMPYGPSPMQPVYYTPATVASLITASNA
jgi:hypothetical protein